MIVSSDGSLHAMKTTTLGISLKQHTAVGVENHVSSFNLSELQTDHHNVPVLEGGVYLCCSTISTDDTCKTAHNFHRSSLTHSLPCILFYFLVVLSSYCLSILQRITYTQAIEILEKAVADGVEFEQKPVWGMDLPSEFERYICEKVYKKPVVLTNYPKDIKAFYMKVNEDGKTVAAADILVPKIGEIIGGSQREHRLDVLVQRCLEMKLDPRSVWWYLDLRRYGTVPHAGFGLGFERLILFITGLSNIRDVIPFPRWAGNAKF
jgi:aspartyl/asparaginyl-tRNA synthetase